MTSTTSEKVTDNVEDNFSHHGLPLALNSASKIKLCFSRIEQRQMGKLKCKMAPYVPPVVKKLL